MNYRHAFHAGNHGDCLKHALLVWLLRALRRKPAAFCVVDTHAGIGRYDLSSVAATRTGEWTRGIGRLIEDPPIALADYVGLVKQLGLYPGSPVLARALLRPHDRLACCELHPEDHLVLRGLFDRDPQVAVHRRDAREAVAGLLPPAFPRGLVLLDPPYEDTTEFDAVATALAIAQRRFPTGILCAWYPIKHRAPVRSFHQALRDAGLRDMVAAELLVREPINPATLNGSGLVVIKPPFRFEQEALPILAALHDRLRDVGGGFEICRLADE